MRLKPVSFLLAAVLAAGCSTLAVQEQGTMTTFRNPILPGFHPDPSICRVGEDFYLTNSTFEFFPGLPIYHSRDLVNWRLLGNALDRPSQLPLKGANDNAGLYAPTLRHWKGTFYLTCNNVGNGGNFIVTAKDPVGPWSEPMWMNDHEIDGSMLFDDDGKAYYTRHDGGEKGGISQAEFDPATGKLTTPMRRIYSNPEEPWNEGPHLYKIKGLYYLLLAEGGTGTQHQAAIVRSKSPWGPFEPCPSNPILTQRDRPQSPIQCAGHADLVEDPAGNWWMVFLGTRPQNGMSVLGRETFLAPVVWTQDGWPIANGDHQVELEMKGPLPKAHPFPAKPPRDGFDADRLGPEWIHVRNVRSSSFSLKERGGFLRLRTIEDSLNDKSEVPAFAGQRQPDFRVTARASMEFTPRKEGEEAGLCVRANDNNHYEIAVGRSAGKQEVFVRNQVKGRTYFVARRSFEGARVQLEITGSETQYQFAYSTDGKEWTTLAASPSADLTKEKAGGFTGAVIGLYATANGTISDNYADFDWFEMTPGQAPAPIAISPRPTPTPVPPREVWRIRAGGGDLKDSSGNLWSEDAGYSDGETVFSGRHMAGTPDPALYQTERWGSNFTYEFPVPEGKYRVTLKFAETYVKKPGERVFTVYLNGNKMLDRFDILAEAGAMDKAVDKVFRGVSTKDGLIRLQFVSQVQNAKVCAIEIVPER